MDASLAIGELVGRTGVSEGTLRMWERRHGFPQPERLASGHRRYREDDVELVRRVVRERAAGASLAVAIARARDSAEQVDPSVFAGLRRRHPELVPQRLHKRQLLALSRAIEDESCARAERPLLFGSFQRERFYRQSERRWRDLARTAELTVVFADFERPRLTAQEPMELPLGRSDPLSREWAVVCEAVGHAACLAGVELPHRESARTFEVIWSVEPAVVRTGRDICSGLAAAVAPELGPRLADRTDAPPPPGDEQLRLAAAITSRTLERLG